MDNLPLEIDTRRHFWSSKMISELVRIFLENKLFSFILNPLFIYVYICVYIYLVGPENSSELASSFLQALFSVKNWKRKRVLDSVFYQCSTTWVSRENCKKTESMLSPAPPHHKMCNSSFLPVFYRLHPDTRFQVHNNNSVCGTNWKKNAVFY